MSLNEYSENANLPETRAIMGRDEKPKEKEQIDPTILMSLIRMLRGPGSALSQGLNLGGMGQAQQSQLVAPPPQPSEEEMLMQGRQLRNQMLR